jgi:hypothetical protein
MKKSKGNLFIAIFSAVVLVAVGVYGWKSKCPECPQIDCGAKPTLMSWRVASAHLEDIFTQIPNSSIEDFRKAINEEERKRINAAHGEAGMKADQAHVYGEPTPMATDLIMAHINAGENDTFVDLGCGRGFMMMQVLMTTPVKVARGVELATSRINIGKQAYQTLLSQALLPAGKKLELVEGDMTKFNIDDATIIFMDSVLFSDELLNTMAKRMSRVKNLRKLVMITKGLPTNPWFELEGSERMKMSWSPNNGSEVLFFKRTAAPAAQ